MQAATTRGVSHCGQLAIYMKNLNFKAKEELWKFKYFSMQKYNLQKNPLKETKILQDIIITLQLISSFNTSQTIIFQKSSYGNRPIMGQKPLSYYTQHNNILALVVGKANKLRTTSIIILYM
jgi:uncharacterized metal-binding protein